MPASVRSNQLWDVSKERGTSQDLNWLELSGCTCRVWFIKFHSESKKCHNQRHPLCTSLPQTLFPVYTFSRLAFLLRSLKTCWLLDVLLVWWQLRRRRSLFVGSMVHIDSSCLWWALPFIICVTVRLEILTLVQSGLLPALIEGWLFVPSCMLKQVHSKDCFPSVVERLNWIIYFFFHQHHWMCKF